MTSRLLQLTDLHVFADHDATLKGIPTRDCLLDILANIEQLESEFHHVVLTGDHTHDELPATYRDIKSLLAPWLRKLRMVPGNHDDRDAIREVFPQIVPATDPLTFVFEVENWHLIGLDSHCPGEVHGTLGKAQLEWFADQVKSIAGPIGVFMHHPPVSLNSPWMDRISLTDAIPMREVVTQNSQIQFVSCGHVHHESTHRLGEAVVYTTPATGLQFDPNGDTPKFADQAPGYRVFEFDGAEFRTEVKRLPENRFHPDPAT